MKFELPLGLNLEIKRFPTEEEYIDFDPTKEEPGVWWNVFCEDSPLPWHAKTKLQAYAIAMSYQHGAWMMYEEMKRLNRVQNETE